MAEPHLTVFAEMHAKPGKENELRRALIGMIEPTRREAGCVQYDLHVGHEDPRHYFFYENWTSKKELDAHLASPHLKAFVAIADELLVEPLRIVLATRVHGESA
jgi:quinol monooxygenase YgiN